MFLLSANVLYIIAYCNGKERYSCIDRRRNVPKRHFVPILEALRFIATAIAYEEIMKRENIPSCLTKRRIVFISDLKVDFEAETLTLPLTCVAGRRRACISSFIYPTMYNASERGDVGGVGFAV